jgi:hypothetical protein
VEVHRLDSEIEKLKSQRKLLPVSLHRIETRLNRQRQNIEEKRGQLKALRAENHSQEVSLRAAEEEVGKLARQLNTVRNNKEFQALQHEIAAKRADAGRIEDQVLAIMGDIEALERDIREIEQSIAKIESEREEEAAGVEKAVQKLDGQIAKLQATRAGGAAAVDAELLAEYERIAAKRGASALAAVVSNTCQGCFLQIPPQFGHVLRAGRQIVRCPSCSRLLYLP